MHYIIMHNMLQICKTACMTQRETKYTWLTTTNP